MDAFQFAAPQGHADFARVQSIGLHPLAGGAGDHGWRHDQTGKSRCRDLIVKTKPRRTRLVGEGNPPASVMSPAICQQMFGAVGNLHRFHFLRMIRKRHINMFLVNIEPRKNVVVAG